MGQNIPLILQKKSWNKSYMVWTTSKYTLTTLMSLAKHGKNIKFYLTKFCLALIQMASPLTHSNVHGPSKTQIGLDIGWRQLAPWKKCISAIFVQEPPWNIKEMYGFLCAVNIRWLMWSKGAHLHTPLSYKSGKRPFVGCQKWTKHLKCHENYSGCGCPYGIPQPQYTILHFHQCILLPNGCCNHPTKKTCCILFL